MAESFTQKFLDDITPVIVMEIHDQEPSIHSRHINAFVAGYFAAREANSYSVDEIVKQFFRWWHNWI